MKNMLPLITLWVYLLALASCTSSPFGSDDIVPGARKVSGKVQFNDLTNAKNAYVWLEGLNIGARVAETGEFELILPAPSVQGGPNGVTGIFNLYFYEANYHLSVSQMIIREGEFVYSQGDINAKGELLKPKVLGKFLDIETELSPSVISLKSTDSIQVEVTLRAIVDSVFVIFPKTFANADILGGILIKNVNSEQIFTVQTFPGIELREAEIIEPGIPHRRTMEFTLLLHPFETGIYEVIPYFLIRQEAIPTGLLHSLGEDREELSPAYLNLPMNREGGRLEIIE